MFQRILESLKRWSRNIFKHSENPPRIYFFPRGHDQLCPDFQNQFLTVFTQLKLIFRSAALNTPRSARHAALTALVLSFFWFCLMENKDISQTSARLFQAISMFVKREKSRENLCLDWSFKRFKTQCNLNNHKSLSLSPHSLFASPLCGIMVEM